VIGRHDVACADAYTAPAGPGAAPAACWIRPTVDPSPLFRRTPSAWPRIVATEQPSNLLPSAQEAAADRRRAVDLVDGALNIMARGVSNGSN
jgi:hypothetical protein